MREYKKLADAEPGVIFGGRLGEYKYYDMDKVIEAEPLDVVAAKGAGEKDKPSVLPKAPSQRGLSAKQTEGEFT